MAYSLIWSDAALQDLEGIAAYIAKDSPHYAALTVERIFTAVEVLREFPRAGRVVPEYTNASTRELLWRHYRIVYCLEEERVGVVAVVHGARRLPEGLDVSEDRPPDRV